MKFNCGPTKSEKRVDYERRCENWHPKFAWWPTRVGPNDCRWMEFVERKGSSDPLNQDRKNDAMWGNWGRRWVDACGYRWEWEYRALQVVHRYTTSHTPIG